MDILIVVLVILSLALAIQAGYSLYLRRYTRNNKHLADEYRSPREFHNPINRFTSSSSNFTGQRNRPGFKLLTFVGVALFLVFCLTTLAAIPHTRADATVGTGTPSSCDEASLDAALGTGGVIIFNCGPNPYNIPITSRKIISVDTTLDGTGPGITFDGHKSTTQLTTGMFLVASNVSFTVKNLSFINAQSNENGAVINSSNNSILVVSNSTFNNNISTVGNNYEGGGAIFLGPNVAATINTSQFTYNKAPSGGAINSRDSVSLVISGTTFLGNEATGSDGGAIYSHAATSANPPPMTFQLEASKVYSNVAKIQGGGLSVSYLNATESGEVKTVDISGNNVVTAGGNGRGGGIYIEQGQFSISRSAIYNNKAPDSGGGIFIARDATVNPYVTVENTSIGGNQVYNSNSHGGGISRTSGTLFLTYVTVAGNSSVLEGGGIYTGVTGSHSSGSLDITLTNSLVTGNTISAYNYFANCSDAVTNGGHNFQYNSQTPGLYDSQDCATGITKTDPKITSLLNLGGPTPTFGLFAGSPAIDGIPAANCNLNQDQRGFPRPLNTKCDSGTFEGFVQPPTLALSFNPSTVGTGSVSTLTFSLNNTSSAGVNITGVSFKDDLPTNLKVATNPNLFANCAGPTGNPTVTFTNSGSTINVNSASLSPGQPCTISVDVVNQLSSSGSLVTKVGLITYLGNQNYTSNAQATLSVVDSTPRNLTASTVSNNQIHLAWQNGSDNATGYRIERSNNGTSNFQFLANVGPNALTYEDSGLGEATTYNYRVSAILGSGFSTASNYAGATTLLNPPTNLTGTASGNQITLNWQNNSTHQTGFKLERRTGPAGTYSVIASPTGTTYIDSGLVSGTIYYYRVRAVNSTPALNSVYSNEVGVVIPGTIIVTSITEDGSGAAGSLKDALSQATGASNKTITFNLDGGGNTITVNSGVTLTVGPGITLAGSCAGGPGIIIKGANLQLGGNDILFGLQLIGPAGGAAPLLTNKTTSGVSVGINTGNNLSCVSVRG